MVIDTILIVFLNFCVLCFHRPIALMVSLLCLNLAGNVNVSDCVSWSEAGNHEWTQLGRAATKRREDTGHRKQATGDR